ncbi:hypothetical protein LEP1GSC079_2595 [Leptospira interrogans str. FPW1039]|uniref:Uncharacterized protein n=1 Tax=Leptospira interrogans str. FPW1039 TaxID=1193040 RepID=A0A0F6I9N0_LEPIR|nr:hypothetical protein LEP1GSC045_4293 [Leptospira interrogans serovar Pomona str. Kennewicki LC82-25]EKN96905.1 hypothetical protein LEP1GSC014_1309 [Leptospira interrogans serovar Pomona str. Pomona]EKO71713.1 hypothetical protein LEP1GSC069_3357 [Leptospira interrogans serovar Canicola str. Fiocruz LV133]EKR26668.1 hypothetical protein LEP1GSC087_3647 [Leptospira interrogans serovar Bataviae str. L1111]EKR34613.1 hypothetical protein LEP1GSC096_3212 [Leptospira interrogans serovar Hebdomadi
MDETLSGKNFFYIRLDLEFFMALLKLIDGFVKSEVMLV